MATSNVESLGIPKHRGEAERHSQAYEQRTAMETSYFDYEIYIIRLELLLHKNLYNRVDSPLESDLNYSQIRSLRVSHFDNFFRLD